MTKDQQGKLLPFFARFLSVSEEESAPDSPSIANTKKWPSDWEDY